MGFDLEGESGNYFRNNVWFWRPVLVYLKEVVKLSDKMIGKMSYNDGYKISEKSANRIARILKEELTKGNTKKWRIEYEATLENSEDEECDLCDKNGEREWSDGMIKCNKCNGTRKVRPFITNYPFCEENIKEFAQFCEESKGFRVW